MARTNNLSNFLTDVAAAIKTKKGDNTPIPANTFDTEIENLGGGDIVNGIIEQYKAESGTIDANTFVEFVNQYNFTIGTDTGVSETGYAGYRISAVKLSEDKVFIAHNYGNSTTNYYLYGIVCTISGDTITKGTDTKLNTNNKSGLVISAVALSNNKVFVAHNYGATSDPKLYGIVCTIDGTTITTGTDTQLSTTSYYGILISAVKLSENKVFIANGSSTLYGIVCTINDTTITAGTNIELVTGISTSGQISAVVLSDDKVLVTHVYDSSNNYLYGIVCTITNDTITAGTDTQLSTAKWTGSVISAVALSNNKVFVAHSYYTGNSGNYYLYGLVCEISGTTITKGTDTLLSSTSYSGNNISVGALSNRKVFVAHSYSSSNSNLYGMICIIGGTTITKGTDTQLSNTYNTSYTISATTCDNKVFIAHSPDSGNSYNLYGMIATLPELTIQPSTSNIQGLTKTECSPTTAGDVFVLDN